MARAILTTDPGWKGRVQPHVDVYSPQNICTEWGKNSHSVLIPDHVVPRVVVQVFCGERNLTTYLPRR